MLRCGTYMTREWFRDATVNCIQMTSDQKSWNRYTFFGGLLQCFRTYGEVDFFVWHRLLLWSVLNHKLLHLLYAFGEKTSLDITFDHVIYVHEYSMVRFEKFSRLFCTIQWKFECQFGDALWQFTSTGQRQCNIEQLYWFDRIGECFNDANTFIAQ